MVVITGFRLEVRGNRQKIKNQFKAQGSRWMASADWLPKSNSIAWVSVTQSHRVPSGNTTSTLPFCSSHHFSWYHFSGCSRFANSSDGNRNIMINIETILTFFPESQNHPPQTINPAILNQGSCLYCGNQTVSEHFQWPDRAREHPQCFLWQPSVMHPEI